MKSINPVKPVAPYLGGKSRLAKQVIARINGIPHTTYAEPFVGMAGVFLRRNLIPEGPKAEVINDLNKEVSTFFRILQRHYVAFLDMLRFQLTTRTEFNRLLVTDPETLTDLERAARFLYIQRTVFGGNSVSRSFGVAPDRSARFDLTKLVPALEDVHTRLSGVVIECLPYADFLRRYDRPGTLFYLDPPYDGCENDYGKGMFSPDDFFRLADLLKHLAGHFILSINETPKIRDIFRDFKITPVKTSYSISVKGSTAAAELIITD